MVDGDRRGDPSVAPPAPAGRLRNSIVNNPPNGPGTIIIFTTINTDPICKTTIPRPTQSEEEPYFSSGQAPGYTGDFLGHAEACTTNASSLFRHTVLAVCPLPTFQRHRTKILYRLCPGNRIARDWWCCQNLLHETAQQYGFFYCKSTPLFGTIVAGSRLLMRIPGGSLSDILSSVKYAQFACHHGIGVVVRYVCLNYCNYCC